MKTLNKLTLLAAALAAFTFVSCEQENKGPEYSFPSGQGSLSFLAEELDDITVTADDLSFNVELIRGDVSAAQTGSLNIKGVAGDKSYPFTVTDYSFAAGEGRTSVRVDLNGIEVAVPTTVTLEIPQAQLDTLSGIQTLSAVVTREGTWTSLGYCRYTDDIITAVFGVQNLIWSVEVLSSNDISDLFRLVNPYDGKYAYNDPGDWDDSKTYYLEINAHDNNNVTIARQYLGFDWGYGNFNIWSLDPGTYADGKITFPVDGIALNLPDWGSTYANNNGKFCVDMSNMTAEPLDFAIAE